MEKISVTDSQMRPKQADIVSAAYELFKKHGFQRVSIDEICKSAGASKMTFYKYYPSKDDLVLSLIRKIFRTMEEEIYNILESDLTLKAKLDMASVLKQEIMAECGDEFMRSAMNYPAAKEYIDEQSENSWEYFKKFMISEQQKGNINPHIGTELFMFVLKHLNKLYSMEGFSDVCENPVQLIREVNELLVYGILSRRCCL